MKKFIFFSLFIFYTATASELATIVMPDITVASLVNSNTSESDILQLIEPNDIATTPKLTADIIGALIKTDNFRIIQSLDDEESAIESNVYYLLGTLNYVGENEDSYPIKATNNITKRYMIEVEADFKLVRVKDNVIMANFSATGSSSDVKIVAAKSDSVWHHNIGKLVQRASINLANNVVNEMVNQFNFTLNNERKTKGESVVVSDVKVYN